MANADETTTPTTPTDEAASEALVPEGGAPEAEAPAEIVAEEADTPAAPATEESAAEELPVEPATEPAVEPAADKDAGAETAAVAEKPVEKKPVPTPAAVPTPGKPAAAAPAPAKPVETPLDPRDAAEAAKWGRVDPDGTVWVREASGERTVGQFPDVDADEALAFYVRRYLDLVAQVKLFESRISNIAPKEIDQTLAALKSETESPAAVGDLDGLRNRLALAEERAIARRAEVQAEREAAKAAALVEREKLVSAAETIAGQDTNRTQWKHSSEQLRELLEQWKNAQRSGPRIDKPSEDELWKRFAKARTTFDRNRRQFFAERDAESDTAKKAKEALIARAEALSSSTDWGRTAGEYRELMNEWKAAGRARRKDDDSLWERFRAAQQVFFDARESQNRQIDEEYGQNLEVKLEILTEAEALLPVTDVKAARNALRTLQDRWDAAGRVPRADVKTVEARMRAVEQAVRDKEDAEWRRSNPETQARVAGATSQLEASIAELEKDLEKAKTAKNARKEKEISEALTARKAWLKQIQNLD